MEKVTPVMVPVSIHHPLRVKAAELGVPMYEVIKLGLEALKKRGK
jgi:hypothetical protein